MSGGRILLVDDDRVFRLSTAALLRGEGLEVQAAATAAEGADAIAQSTFDLAILDLRMPGVDGIALSEVMRRRGLAIPILMISGFGSVDSAVEALHSGVDDFLTKPVEPEILLSRVRQLLSRRPSEPDGEPELGIVGASEALVAIRREIRQVAGSDATVLVTGETGTGKELVARAVHEESARSGSPFVPMNCAALSEGVLESELFGHVRGAYTGAVKDRQGLIRASDGGTLFLDEIGDVSQAVQQRLLRVLQEREVVPLGSHRPVSVDIRLVVATNKNLRAEVSAGRFREDLFFRLNVFHIHLPPLRERSGDIPLLVDHVLRARGRAGTSELSPLAMRTLLACSWPGNVRQLISALESASIRAGTGGIHAHHLPEEVRGEGDSLDWRYRPPESEADEREAIVRALRRAGGVRTRAADLLGMGRTTLWRKMRDYGIEDVD